MQKREDYEIFCLIFNLDFTLSSNQGTIIYSQEIDFVTVPSFYLTTLKGICDNFTVHVCNLATENQFIFEKYSKLYFCINLQIYCEDFC